MNPGPVVLSQRVREALLGPDLCHREEEFGTLQGRIRAELLAVYTLPDRDYAAVLLTGTGSAALEAMLCSAVPADGRVLILENGVYGERLRRIAEIHGIRHRALRHAWDEPLALQRVSDALRAEPDLCHVAVVHHETTTGRLNDIAGLAAHCAERGVSLLVDAVSSFGAEEINFTDWPLAALAATANKCLHGIPGVAFVVLRRATLHAMQDTPPRSLYLDLRNYLAQQDRGGTPFTQSVQGYYGLAEALAEHREAGGWRRRRGRYWQRMERVREGLTALGISPLLAREQCSAVLNAFHLPPGMDYRTLHDQLKRRGYIIYAGQGALEKRIFRISCMGEITMQTVEGFLEVLQEIL